MTLAFVSNVQAEAITLFNTAADASSQTDAHWTIIVGPGISTPVPAQKVTNVFSGYVTNLSSGWIWADADGTAGINSPYTFRQTFDLTGFDPSTATITGQWAADNQGYVVLNGISSGIGTGVLSLSGDVIAHYGTLHSFTLTSGFRAGINTLDFVITDVGFLGGLNVTGLTATATPSAHAFLSLEKSTGNLNSWQKVPLTSSLLTADGDIDAGVASSSSEFFRLKIKMSAATSGTASGIYMGKFTGEPPGGDFGVLLGANNVAYLLGCNTTPDGGGVFSSGFSVSNGTFNMLTLMGVKASGTFTSSNSVSGNYTNPLSQTGSFMGVRKNDTGIHAADVGYYAGVFTNITEDTFGSAHALVAADGSIIFYWIDSSGEGGASGTFDAGNTISTTMASGLSVFGALNTSTHVITGTCTSNGQTMANFEMTRTLAP